MKIVNQNGDGCIICAAGLGFNPASDICEQCPTGSNPLEGGTCVCDQSLGFTGLDGFACTDCFEENLTAVGNACTPCPSKTTFSVDKCVCDESKGFVGDASSCSDCWKQNMVVQADSCIPCLQLDLNSVFSVNSCQCAPKFVNKTGLCELDTRNMTIAVAVSVPIAVVILSLAAILFVLKRKQKKTAQNREVIQRTEVEIAVETGEIEDKQNEECVTTTFE
ncbi:Growth_factor receptor cysteine-rich domain superfamily [Hexamita inflata]|uniref:Growth factor receptor cysteine-rich domain superfamily n=1 Tax=Hexamita inflata TaxID=28002 RepID=A0AA86Q806_9EUKA|nr:Growth factor receptor cysteine-rich domain superfamily [Hexamita inflata]